MPDILKPRSIIETGDTVRIPDVEEAPPPLPEETVEGDGVFTETAFSAEAADEAPDEVPDTEAEEEALPEEIPEPEPVVMTREELAECFREELAELCDDAIQKGYADGMTQKKGELKECIARVDQQLAQMQELQTAFMARFARELRFLAVDIAEKLIYSRIEEDDQTLQTLVMQTVGGVKNADWLDVEISEQLVGLVEALKRELEKPEYHGRATVTPSACPADTVRVTTQDGTVVASISTQGENLRDIFRKN